MTGKILLVGMGFAFSIFLGCQAVPILVDTTNPVIQAKKKLRSWQVHQFWLNFIGSLVGWAATYYLIFFRFLPISQLTFKLEDSIVAVFALLGITGFLPNTLSRLTSVK
jgi:hypothetical protein